MSGIQAVIVQATAHKGQGEKSDRSNGERLALQNGPSEGVGSREGMGRKAQLKGRQRLWPRCGEKTRGRKRYEWAA